MQRQTLITVSSIFDGIHGAATVPPMIVAVRTAGTMFIAVVAVIRGLIQGSAAICGDYGPANAMVDTSWGGMGGGVIVTKSGIVRRSEAVVQS